MDKYKFKGDYRKNGYTDDADGADKSGFLFFRVLDLFPARITRITRCRVQELDFKSVINENSVIRIIRAGKIKNPLLSTPSTPSANPSSIYL